MRSFYEKSWKVGAFSTAEQNSELNLELRAYIGLNVCKSFVQTIHSEIGFNSGILANTEKSISGNQSNNLEGKFQIGYRYSRFKNPEFRISVNITANTSLNVSDRIRVDSNINAKVAIIKDFYFSIAFYQNYDSKPPGEQQIKAIWV
ncbi:MAG: DUF481 domain-containing protein [Bacteroidetes bacterium]|nr:DUF481 domain-containing protein [Bacteroidota bacterium]